jgi:hypothetical protein
MFSAATVCYGGAKWLLRRTLLCGAVRVLGPTGDEVLAFAGDEVADPGDDSRASYEPRALCGSSALDQFGIEFLAVSCICRHMLARSSETSFWALLSVPTDVLDVWYVPCLCCPVRPFPPCMA